VQRNRGAELACGDIIFSIDDDAEFISSDTIAQTLGEFSAASIATVAIPFINVNSSNEIRQHASHTGTVLVTDAFTGTAYAIRRDVFLTVGGYREFLFHQGEEEDLCIRMLDKGYFTRLGNADPIHHYESPKRDRRRMDILGARNKILFCWYNVPIPYFFPHLAVATVNRLVFGLRTRHALLAMHGLLKGFAGCSGQAHARRPVRIKTYRLFRKLRRSRETPLDAIESQFVA